ncbi:DUF2141 domain-containing protein [Sphingorhabdus profundilacus]|uniref:DUF2141 domain-containing protein n=1 Tax=Sphingorhabdus profundilacus TaxID=2509718 RepID=UPI001FE34862|nr:DUF2141 domain-containing protein [Sphingorhabdus profundilacus]
MAIGVTALVPGTALDATSTTSTLDLSIYGLRSMKGNVLVCVTANPKFFPDCSKDPKSHRAKVAASNAANISFDGLEQGTYAVALIHDENANSKMDMAIFLPKEGFGFSRNPVIVAGPPRFKAAAFAIDAAEVSQRVKMKYML